MSTKEKKKKAHNNVKKTWYNKNRMNKRIYENEVIRITPKEYFSIKGDVDTIVKGEAVNDNLDVLIKGTTRGYLTGKGFLVLVHDKEDENLNVTIKNNVTKIFEV